MTNDEQQGQSRNQLVAFLGRLPVFSDDPRREALLRHAGLARFTPNLTPGQSAHIYVDTLLHNLEKAGGAAYLDPLFDAIVTQANLTGDPLNRFTQLRTAYLSALGRHPPPPQSDPRHQLRAPVADFVGRAQEIAQLTQALTGDDRAAAICGLRGMGGIGKTELAFVVANQLAAHFPDGQIVVELFGASNPVAPEAALQAAVRAFEPAAKLPDDLPTLTADYLRCLAGKRVLIVADDARDAAQVRPLLPPAGCALLVTSRQSFKLPGMRRFDLGTLPEPEAEALLLAIYEDIGEHAPELARLCGCLPLALRVSATLLANDATRPVARYLEQLQTERLRHLADPDADPNDPAASVAASLALSYAALPPAAQQTFAQLGVFVGDFALEAAEAVLAIPATPSPIPDTLGLLHRRSLLEYDTETARYDLHDLVRAFALARLQDQRPTRLRHAQYYVQVADSADNLYLKGKPLEGLALFDRERRQIDAAWGWAMGQAGIGDGVAGIGVTDAATITDTQHPTPDIDRLLIAFADATAYVGEIRYDVRRERIPQLEAQAAAAHRLGERKYEGNALGNLGLAYDSLGEYPRAIEHHEQALEVLRGLGDRRGEGSILGNLGNAYDSLGDYPRAIEHHEQYLAIAREIGDRRGEGNALGNLGNAYYSLGDYPRAIEHHEQALVISREIGDRRGEGNALGNLGIAYDSLGEYPRAIETLEQRLAIAREIGNIQGVAIASWNLGLLYEQQGDLARAVPLMQVCVDFEQQIGHADAEKDAARLEGVRRRLAGGA